MKSYWNLDKDNKRKFLSRLIETGKHEHSMNNKVIVSGNIVLKCNTGVKKSKRARELLIFKKIGLSFEEFENNLIFKKREGSLIRGTERINEKDIIDKLICKIKEFSSISKEDIPKFNFINKIKTSETEILDTLRTIGIDNKIFYDVSSLTLKEDVVSHCDLNLNNILLNEKDNSIELIDFEETVVASKYNDPANLLSNWPIEDEQIDKLCRDFQLKKKILLNISIIWCCLIIIWNKSRLQKLESNGKYEEQVKKTSIRAAEIWELLKRDCE